MPADNGRAEATEPPMPRSPSPGFPGVPAADEGRPVPRREFPPAARRKQPAKPRSCLLQGPRSLTAELAMGLGTRRAARRGDRLVLHAPSRTRPGPCPSLPAAQIPAGGASPSPAVPAPATLRAVRVPAGRLPWSHRQSLPRRNPAVKRGSAERTPEAVPGSSRPTFAMPRKANRR